MAAATTTTKWRLDSRQQGHHTVISNMHLAILQARPAFTVYYVYLLYITYCTLFLCVPWCGGVTVTINGLVKLLAFNAHIFPSKYPCSLFLKLEMVAADTTLSGNLFQ